MSRMRSSLRASVFASLWLAVPCAAQYVEESFTLEVGWTTIVLGVDPIPDDPDSLFGGLPVDAVWTQSRPPGVLGIPDGCTGPDSNDPECRRTFDTFWRFWVPVGNPNRGAVDLKEIRGSVVYLVKSRERRVVQFSGVPNSAKQAWVAGFNTAGFHVDPDVLPGHTFDDYLSPSPLHANTRVIELGTDGAFTEVASLDTNSPEFGKGYWVWANADGEYDGPLDIDAGTLHGVSFARLGTSHTVRVKNLTDSERTVTIDYQTSASTPSDTPARPVNAGDVPTRWFEILGGVVGVDDIYKWRDLPADPYSVDLSPHSSPDGTWLKTVELGVDRTDGGTGAQLATLDIEDDGIESQYAGLLKISDGAGFRRIVPVTAEVTSLAGLWYGFITVDRVRWETAGAPVLRDPRLVGCGCEGGVCQNTEDIDQNGFGDLDGAGCLVCVDPSTNNDPSTCILKGDHSICDCPDIEDLLTMPGADDDTDIEEFRPTNSPLAFPVIIHLDSSGTAKLLTEVTLLFEPDTPGSTAGRYRVTTPSCSDCGDLVAGSFLNGQLFARRLTTIGYAAELDEQYKPIDNTLSLTGSFGGPGARMEAVITMPPDHPLNPFRHKFHPDHDCNQVGECYKLSWEMGFEFADAPRPGETEVGWGFSFMTGEYDETMTISAKPLLDPGPCGCAGGACEGGPNDGFGCATYADCACTPQCGCGDVCSGGDRDGESCLGDEDCTDGTCTDMACVGGAVNRGQDCTDAADCTCIDQAVYSVKSKGLFELSRISEVPTLNRQPDAARRGGVQ